MKTKTLCIAEWQSFGTDEIAQILNSKTQDNPASFDDSANAGNELKNSSDSQAKNSLNIKAQKIFNEFAEFAKCEGNDNFLQLIRKNGERLKAKNYVGLIQTKSGFSLEILPKTFKSDENKGFSVQICKCKKLEFCDICKAKKLLLKMLKTLKNSPFKESSFALLKTAKLPLFEVFILMFLTELEKLVQKGIKSAYLTHEKNRKFLKGKLLFNENLKYNFAHKERFFTASDEFSQDIAPNRIIKTTLEFLKTQNLSQTTSNKLAKALFVFAKISASKNKEHDFAQCQNTRNFTHYSLALKWCKVFLRRETFAPYNADSNAFALLFDMNKLFESFVANQMKKWLSDENFRKENGEKYKDFMQEIFETKELENLEKIIIKTQEKNKFLIKERLFALSPDLVLYKNTYDKIAHAIADTKWKIIASKDDKYGISQGDLYQIFAYASKYKLKESFLIYPKYDTTDKDDKELQKTGKKWEFKAEIFTNCTNKTQNENNKISLKILFFPLFDKLFK